ncbi:GNAT family N-acetyltransferase [Actinoplanes ianthinogenes]|uniref:YitH/HolE acetyltransferase (GNAT) domain-containing protein n=1 Tax=Actinoplanes ianthinogenes TaxID=122358 RepID=A0ABM7M6X7_9ACTN|nr:GNAT family N-acetyltransferase [Actinoplanes ianthinogenes]BCJ47350.1 hypothetical protein Aiant_80070 [Actinoplanes ianthinogenes]
MRDVELLTVNDLSQCLALARDRGWPAEDRKWRLLFELGTVFGIRDTDGELIATAILTRYDSRLSAPAAPRSRPATPADLPAIAALDTAVVGAARGELIARLPAFATRLHVLEAGGAVVGYGAAWPGVDLFVIGPVLAPDHDGAAALITDLAGGVDAPVRVDLFDRDQALRDWVERSGAVWRSSVTMMIRGGASPPGDQRRVFSPAMQALG